jgi:hypothetical protein
MVRGRKGKEYDESQLREAYNMYVDATIPYSKIFESTGVSKPGLERYIAQSSLEIIRRKITRSRSHVNDGQVNELILAGKTVKAVSEQLHLTVNTVKNHMSDEVRSLYLSTKRRGRAPKASALSVDEKLKIAQKMYEDTKLSFKQVQETTDVFLKSLKGYIAVIESMKQL